MGQLDAGLFGLKLDQGLARLGLQRKLRQSFIRKLPSLGGGLGDRADANRRFVGGLGVANGPLFLVLQGQSGDGASLEIEIRFAMQVDFRRDAADRAGHFPVE